MYQVLISDLYGSQRGHPRLTYRLLIRREQPDFSVVSATQQRDRGRCGDRSRGRAVIGVRGGDPPGRFCGADPRRAALCRPACGLPR